MLLPSASAQLAPPAVAVHPACCCPQAAQGGGAARIKLLPSLAHMTRLSALNLADNNLARVPADITRLTALEVLDLRWVGGRPSRQPGWGGREGCEVGGALTP